MESKLARLELAISRNVEILNSGTFFQRKLEESNMEKLEQCYSNPEVNRAYWLTCAMIKFRSYEIGKIDSVAAECSDHEIAAFCKIIDKLNK